MLQRTHRKQRKCEHGMDVWTFSTESSDFNHNQDRTFISSSNIYHGIFMCNNNNNNNNNKYFILF